MAKLKSVLPPKICSKPSICYLLLLLLFLAGCRPTRRISEGEYFLRKQKIEIASDSLAYDFDKEDLKPILKQKTNRKILLVRFHLWAYNQVNPERKERSHLRKQKRVAECIEKKQVRLRELKETPDRRKRRIRKLEAKIADLQKSDVQTWRDWLTETVGEPPVILDSLKTKKSAEQMSIYLSKNGYFNNDVDYEVSLSRNEKKAKVTYEVTPGVQYKLRDITYEINDDGILSRLDLLKKGSELKPGVPFSVSAFDKERARMADYLTNHGYFGFTKDYIVYKADSAIGGHQVDLKLQLLNSRRQDVASSDSTVTYDHKRYYIGDIYVDTDFDLRDASSESTDTLLYQGLHILSKGELKIKPDLLAYTVYFNSGDLYQKDRAQKTFRRFNNLQLFRSVSIQFEPREGENFDLLDCYIRLTPAKKQFIALQTRGTHSDGNLGIEADVNFTNRNLFKGAEQGNITISTGLEAQPALTQTDQDVEITGGDVAQGLRLNTFEIGPEVSLTFHNILQLDLDRFSRNSTPTSKLAMAFNYQTRPDYTRTLTELRYEGRWIENITRGRSYFFHFPEISLIKIDKSLAFQELLESINDDFLTNSYQDHFIFSTLGLGATFNNQSLKRKRRYHYFTFNLDGAGTALRGAMKLFGASINENDAYEVAGIQFAHFTRFEVDYREYWNFDEKNTVVARVSGGMGKPWTNLSVLPFEKSFFSGGANSVRAWQARTLGPGSYRDTTALVTFNNIGELKLESNLEYRFDITPSFEGAIFLDVGNVWMLQSNDARPGAAFGSDWLSELAVGTGLGFRFDMDFFLIRVDLGMQLKDPAKVPGERWIWEPKDEYESYVAGFYPAGQAPGYFPVVNFNLGIGYPF